MSVLKAFAGKGKILIGHCAAGLLFDFAGITEGKRLAVHPLAKPAVSKGMATDENRLLMVIFIQHKVKTLFGQ